MPRTSKYTEFSSDLKKLQGVWHITALETDGHKMPPVSFQGSQIIIKDNQFTSIAMSAMYEGTIEVDEYKKPKAFDLVFTAGPQKGARNLGIYKLTRGSWTICLAMQGTRRPREFATKAHQGIALETLKRKPTAKPRATQPAAPEEATIGEGAATELEGEWAMISAVFNGQPLDPSMVKFCKRVTRGNVTTVLAGPQTMLKARFTLDISRNRNAIDYVNLHGGNKGKSQKGIFELTGKELKICVSPPGKPRPEDFSSKRGDGRNYTVWQLDKK
jgi:uncharacterized protein (TIGR03067 family)